MKSIESIVQKINETAVRQLECETGEIFPVQAFGLAFPVQITEGDSDQSIPALILNDGECVYPFSDDDFAAGWYHRMSKKAYGKVSGYGDGDIDVEIADIVLVVWGFSDQLGMSNLEFEKNILIPSIPKYASLVSSDFDSYRVCHSEFRNVNYLNKPEEFVFSVSYRVQYKFDRACALETNCV
jgi:hypothetical protein